MRSNTPVSLDDKWTTTRGRILLSGTQALARVLLAQSWLDRRAGLNTAGYISGYRGSPLGNVDTTLWSIGKRLEAADIRFQPGINEDLAATAIAGTQQIGQVPRPNRDGVFAAWYGKGPGVDRCGDAFKHGNYAGAHAKGGVVLFYGDDHAGKSSTVAHQSEQALAASLIPSFYPANVGEILNYGLLAFALSRHSGTWMALKCVNEIVEQTASVDLDLESFAPVLPPAHAVPPEGLHAAVRPFNPLRAEQIVVEYRLPLIAPFVRANRIDRTTFRATRPRLAIVSAGKSHGDVLQALALLGLDDAQAQSHGISLYKVGCIWPLDAGGVADFARGHETLLVVEEKKSLLEVQIAIALVNEPTAPLLIGKRDERGAPLLSSVLPLEPADIARIIAGRLRKSLDAHSRGEPVDDRQYKILYNDAVAMTGGQPVDGPLSVAAVAQQMHHEGVRRIVVLSDNPDFHRRSRAFPPGLTIDHRDRLDRIQRELRETAGCTVLIYEQTCAAEKRRRRKKGKFPDPSKRVFIAEDVCEGCGDCSVQSTCVSIVPKDTAFGRKRAIDQSSCNKDYSCADGFCPSFITVRGAEPRRPKGASVDEGLFAALPEPNVAAGSCNIMVAGIGGTGVITVGALLAMAAHIDGRAASVFDMTGLAQKNGAVFSHVRVTDAPDGIHTQRLGRAEADVLLAFDLVAALSPESASTLSQSRTRAVANATVTPTAAFQFQRDTVPQAEALLERLTAAIGRDRVTGVDASALAVGLTGDTIATNLMVVGMATQMGILPVAPSSLEQAITLNGVAVKLNLAAFRLGRLFIAEPDRVSALMSAQTKPSPSPETLAELVAHRCAHLALYQDEALAQRYRERVAAVHEAEQRAVHGSDALALAFARNYAKLLAIKDEYEVARLLSTPELHATIARTFDSGARLSFNMAPPFLPGRAANGRPRKREFPSWIALPALRLLASLRKLRYTPLDPFGWTAERRSERTLIRDYEALVERTLTKLSPETLLRAVQLLDEVASVRGFGPVKEAALRAYAAGIRRAEQSL
jgi:TPP-dependent indolepyruvate ferredoxin oxidoreductase alpha subunit/Pyruvate/2-oxoacid:ferredoxin oxidoreductase gamma subunit